MKLNTSLTHKHFPPDMFETSGVENLKRKSFWRIVAVWAWLFGCAGFVAVIFAISWHGHFTIAIVAVIVAYVVAFALAIYDARTAPIADYDSELSAALIPSTEGGLDESSFDSASIVEPCGGTLSREWYRQLYHDLDTLTQDFKASGIDTAELLAVKRNVWRKVETMK